MAKNEVVVVKVTKDPVLSTSKATVKNPNGLKFLKLNLVEDTQDGSKWYDGVAFGSLAEVLATKLVKGTEFKAIGPVQMKEYTHKTTGEVKTSLSLIVNKAILEGGLEFDKFTKAPAVAEAKKEEAPF